MTLGYFIIEHPTRGVLQTEPNRNTGKPAFSWSKGRDDEANARYFTLRRALQDLHELDLPPGCQVRSSVPKGEGLHDFWPVVG